MQSVVWCPIFTSVPIERTQAHLRGCIQSDILSKCKRSTRRSEMVLIFFSWKAIFHQIAANAISFTMFSQQPSPHPLKSALNEGEGINKKKLDIRTFTMSYNNGRHQCLNDQKSRLGWPASNVPNERLAYKLVNTSSFF